ncbi:MAG: HEAT repeat domain-containing protein [Sandaracinaceae bacterium]|nr:HEAT repeat domain-containing protein [Sandaracinaceae bacterium]
MFLTPLTPTFEAALRDVRAAGAQYRAASARALGAAEAADEEQARAALEGLVVLSSDADARVRIEALRGLALRRDAGALGHVTGHLGDPAPAVRATALLAAEALGCEDALLVASVGEADPPLQIAALEALVARAEKGEAGGPAASDTGVASRPALVAAATAALADPSEEVRATAVAALAAMGARASLDALAARLDDSPRVRASAALALADLGDARGVPALVEALGRGSFEAAEALGNLGVEAAREPLANSAARLFTPLLTKAAAGAALIRLGDPRGEDALRAVLRAFRPDGRPYAVVQVMQLRLSSLRPELESLVKRPRGVDRDLLRDALAALGSGSAA